MLGPAEKEAVRILSEKQREMLAMRRLQIEVNIAVASVREEMRLEYERIVKESQWFVFCIIRCFGFHGPTSLYGTDVK